MGGTHKLLKGIAYAIFVAGAILIVLGLMGTNDNAVIAVLCGLFGGTIFGSLFLFCAKLLEQNEERYEQQANLYKLLSRIDEKTKGA